MPAPSLSEAQAGSDPAAMRTRAVRDGNEYVITGAKAWTTHGGKADFYTVLFDGFGSPPRDGSAPKARACLFALAGLDSGRLGIAAVATGVALGALEVAVQYAREREAFGKPIIDHQGLAFVLADMAAAVESVRATYLNAARLRDAGRHFSRQASIAKLVATDNAMKVTTDAVQVLGGAGYTRDFPVERYMRESKVMQIFEGTNQIQRLVISRHLAR